MGGFKGKKLDDLEKLSTEKCAEHKRSVKGRDTVYCKVDNYSM